ncbi:MAG: NnrS family protein, partial [Desulfobacterales bacterium]|nr:NnrS family protein [Desulfobacterales bacterium]
AAKKPENLGFLPLLLLAASYNAAFHLDILGLADLGGSTFLLTATVEILLVFVVILSSRILVMFTENGVPGVKTRQYKWIERLAAPSAAAFVIADLLPFTWAVPVASLLALAAALIHAIRLSGWRTGKTLKTPLVWVLHLGYAGLVAALALKGLYNLELVPSSSALHAMTVANDFPICPLFGGCFR